MLVIAASVCPAPIQLIDTNRPVSIYLDVLDPYVCHNVSPQYRQYRMMSENDAISLLE